MSNTFSCNKKEKGEEEGDEDNPQIPTFIFVLDVSATARNSGLLGAELKAVKNTLDSIYEWLQAEAGSGSGESVSNDDGDDDYEDDDDSDDDDYYDQSNSHINNDNDDSTLSSGIDDRSGASIYANVSSAQALYGTTPTTSTPIPPSAAQHKTFSDTNGLFQMPSNSSSSSDDMPTHGPIRVGIVTFDSYVHFYSVKADAPDPIRK